MNPYCFQTPCFGPSNNLWQPCFSFSYEDFEKMSDEEKMWFWWCYCQKQKQKKEEKKAAPTPRPVPTPARADDAIYVPAGAYLPQAGKSSGGGWLDWFGINVIN